jgi:hypothetical protein
MLRWLPSVVLWVVKSDPFDLIMQDSVLVFLMLEDTFDLILLLGLEFDLFWDYNGPLLWIAIALPSLQSRDVDDIMDSPRLWEVQAIRKLSARFEHLKWSNIFGPEALLRPLKLKVLRRQEHIITGVECHGLMPSIIVFLLHLHGFV